MVQVRLEGAPEAEVVRLVTQVRAVLPEGSLVMVNATGRDPAFAGRVGADGAHVGGGDPGVVEAVRRALAPRAVIGFSAHGAA